MADTVIEADVNMIMQALNTKAHGAHDPRPLDHNGKITVLDTRKLVLLCDNRVPTVWSIGSKKLVPRL